MKAAILQSNYIPWKGYFDIAAEVDVFIFHDDLQYTKNDWRNRNAIKTPAGLKWLTIPCGKNEKRLICEVSLTDHAWQQKHWRQIRAAYERAPYFAKFQAYFEEIYCRTTWASLSELNQRLIRDIASDFLKIQCRFEDSRQYGLKQRKKERVLELLKKVGATTYVSGPAAGAYLSHEDFERENMRLVWADYENYPEYPQMHPPFCHAVSILDLLFNTGDMAPDYLKNTHGGRH